VRWLISLCVFWFSCVATPSWASSDTFSHLDQLEKDTEAAYSGYDFADFEHKLGLLLSAYRRLGRSQEEAWTQATYGSLGQGRALEAAIRLRLQTEDVRSESDVVPERRLIRKLTLGHDLKAVFRPQTLENYSPRHDVLYYELSRESGFNIVPVTVFREYKGVFGTAQVYLEDLHLGDKDFRIKRYEDEKLQALDFLTWFLDRQRKNWGRRPGGAVVAIDNDMVFGSPTHTRLRDARPVRSIQVPAKLSPETLQGLRVLNDTLKNRPERVPSIGAKEQTFVLNRLKEIFNADCSTKLETDSPKPEKNRK
jgi:hypothetical protein